MAVRSEQLTSQHMGPEYDNVIPLRPLEEGVLMPDEEVPPISPETAQQNALSALPPYDVRVLRRSTHKEKEELTYGTFHQETVRYSDGAVRLVSIGEPNPSYFQKDGISPNVIVSGDPYFTGPDGINADKLRSMVQLGYHVVWPHHQGRHSVAPTSREHLQTMWRFLSNKGVGRSAHQDQALLDHLAPSAAFSTQEVHVEGYSRSSMKGQAFVALSEQHDRKVIYSDLDAPCFAHESSPKELIEGFLRQLPHGVRGLGRLATQVSTLGAAMGEPNKLRGYLGTFDPHPLNLLHELAWMRPLINGDAGTYAEAMPLDSLGVITLFDKDYMSQQADWRRIHAARPGIVIREKEGSHLAGAYPENLKLKYDRFERIQQYRLEHNLSLTGIEITDILAPEEAKV